MMDASGVCVIMKLDAALWARLQNSSEQTSSFGLEQQNSAKVSQVCGAFFFYNLELMEPLFHVKVSTALAVSCMTFTVLFVPLAK